MKFFSRLFLSGAMTFVLSNVLCATQIDDNNQPSAVQQANNSLSLNQELPLEIIAHIASFSRIREGYNMESVSKEWKHSLSKYNIWKKYAERIQGYSRVKEEYQKEHPSTPINYKEIIQELTKPKEFLNVHSIPGYEKVLIKSISMDGKVFCLEAHNSTGGRKGFRYTCEEGYQLVDSTITNRISDLTMDAKGNTIGGSIKVGRVPGVKAFLWTAETGIQLLDTLWNVKAITIDGKIIAGEALEGPENHRHYNAYISSENDTQSLGTLNNGNKSTVSSISSNGRVIVGSAADGKDNNKEKAFIWTAESGMKSLLNDTISGNSRLYAHSKATCVSADGSTIAGYTQDSKAFRWRAENGIQLLDMLEGMTSSYSQAMSGDGKVILGYTSNRELEKSSFFIWSSTTGMLSISSIFSRINEAHLEEIMLNGDGTLIASKGLSGWYAYMPRYDTFIEEGINLLPTKANSNTEE